MQIGPHTFDNKTIVAPMAGVTDRPFRQLCKRFGAALAVSEMVTSDPKLYGTEKTQRRTNHIGEAEPVSAQIAGSDPRMLADAARYNTERGARIIDINMGCPAKKVCNTMAGSALLRDEFLVDRILNAVVKSVDVPVTLKIRTGWDRENRNAIRIAKIAESSGIRALTIHGRTRACGFSGSAEYETIAEVKASLKIPIIANGDIDSPKKAMRVIELTGADALMIGRAAQGRPWIFREINHHLATGQHLPPPEVSEIHAVLLAHLQELYGFYGEFLGVRIARKHVSWYTKALLHSESFRKELNTKESAQEQLALVNGFFEKLASAGQRLNYVENEVGRGHEARE